MSIGPFLRESLTRRGYDSAQLPMYIVSDDQSLVFVVTDQLVQIQPLLAGDPKNFCGLTM